MVWAFSIVCLSCGGGEKPSEGRFELAAPPAEGRDTCHARRQILRVPWIAHQDDAERRGRGLERQEERAIRGVEVSIVEEENGDVCAARRLGCACDLSLGGFHADDVDGGRDAVG